MITRSASAAIPAPRTIAPARVEARERDWKRTSAKFLLYLILLVGGLGMIFPFVWMAVSSIKHAQDIYSLSLIPPSPTLDNYREVLEETKFARWFANSLIIATITTASVAFFDSLAGYTLAKFNFPGRQLIFIAILSTLMVPTEMLVIPWYVMSTNYGWVNTYWGILFPGLIPAFGVFLMRQFFQALPRELFDAGRVDGVSEFGLFWRIGLPQVRSGMAALGIFAFIGNWNAFLWPLIVAKSPDMRTIPVGVALFSGEAGTAWNLIMAASAMAILPVLIVFFIFQKQIIEGVVLTGVKG